MSLDTSWKNGIEREIGSVKTDIAKIEAHGEAQMGAIQDMKAMIGSLASVQNVKTPITPLVSGAVVVLGAMLAIVLLITDPIAEDVTALQQDAAVLTKNNTEVYYKMGRLEALQEVSGG